MPRYAPRWQCPESPELVVDGDGVVTIEERRLNNPQSVLSPGMARIGRHVSAIRPKLPDHQYRSVITVAEGRNH